jgi:hypothetical protein
MKEGSVERGKELKEEEYNEVMNKYIHTSDFI